MERVLPESESFCSTCARRETCRRICKPLEAHLVSLTGNPGGGRETPFTDLPGPERRALADRLYGSPTALETERSLRCG